MKAFRGEEVEIRKVKKSTDPGQPKASRSGLRPNSY